MRIRLSGRLNICTLFCNALGFALFAFGIAKCGNAPAATLENQLHKHAPEILSKLHALECRRVGVLKFRVRKAGQRSLDDTGTLNTLIAKRLEVALALANPNEETRSIKLVRDASSVAAKARQASYLSSIGIRRLFSQRYPLAWGNENIEVDALITGVVQVAEDLRSLRIGIFAAVNGNPKLEELLRPFVVETDGAILNELGESFQLRSPDGQSDENHAELARDVRRDPAGNFPLNDKPTVALRIFYDGVPVTLSFSETEATIPEPRVGQRVTFELERMDHSDVILGAVLKVNGENTLYRQRRRDIDCAKWVLCRTHGKLTIRGFQKEGNAAAGEAFQVLSKEHSRNKEVYYGPDVGTISLVVFPESKEGPALDLSEDAPDLLAIAAGELPEEPPKNADALKQQLRNNKTDRGTRGIVVDGAEIQQRVQFVSHQWNPEPIMSVVIRYYHARD